MGAIIIFAPKIFASLKHRKDISEKNRTNRIDYIQNTRSGIEGIWRKRLRWWNNQQQLQKSENISGQGSTPKR